MLPIDSVRNNPCRIRKAVTFWPLPKSGIEKMGNWIVKESWECVIKANNANEKAQALLGLVMEQLNNLLPKKCSLSHQKTNHG